MIIKFFPDLTSKEEVVPMVVGRGTFTRPVLHTCLQHKCIAYKFGKCLKYDNNYFLCIIYHYKAVNRFDIMCKSEDRR